jgi:hypothetical protein
MRYPWANVALLALIVGELGTGYAGLTGGSADSGWVLAAHGIGGYLILAVLRWKVEIVWRSWRRRTLAFAPRLAFAILGALFLATLGTGLVWTLAGRILLGGYSLMTVHVGLAVASLPLLAWHVAWARFVFPVVTRIRSAAGRRALVRLAAGTAVGLIAWPGAGSLNTLAHLPGGRRRFSGSYEIGSGVSRFPTVSWLFDDPPPVDPAGWRLAVEGLVERPLTVTYPQLRELARDRLDATLDCTGGWYTRQSWDGVALGRLLDLAGVQPGAASLRVEAISGFWRRYPLDAARGFLLATGVAGAPLDHGHGFPARLVAPPVSHLLFIDRSTTVG